MGIRPFAEQLLQGAEQALSLSDLRASEKVNLTVSVQLFTKLSINKNMWFDIFLL